MGQKCTAKRAQVFLDELRESAHVGDAAQRAGWPKSSLYRMRQEDPQFAAAWDAAIHEAMTTVLEPEAIRRATQGVEEPVFHKGRVVGHVQKYSDTLLIFLMKGGMPDKYKDRVHQEVTGKQNGPVQFEDIVAMSREERLARLAALRAKREQGSVDGS